MDIKMIPAAGDGIAYAGSKLEGASLGQDHPHCFLDGYVYLGFTYTGEDGEQYEAYEAIRCRRCSEAAASEAREPGEA